MKNSIYLLRTFVNLIPLSSSFVFGLLIFITLNLFYYELDIFPRVPASSYAPLHFHRPILVDSYSSFLFLLTQHFTMIA